jgi:dienelactone hydrolase
MDRLIYVSTEEGIVSLWSSDLNGGDRRKITKERIMNTARPNRENNLVVYSVDVSRGRELQKIFFGDNSGEKEPDTLEMEPVRILGLLQHDKGVVYTGSSDIDIALYIGEPGGKAEKLYSSDKIFFSTDSWHKVVVGHGLLEGNPRSSEIFIYDLDTGQFKVYTPKRGSVNGPPKIYNSRLLFTSNYEGKTNLYTYDIDKDLLEPAKFLYDDYLKHDIKDYVNYGWTETGKIWFIGKTRGRGIVFYDGQEVKHPRGTPTYLEEHHGILYLTLSSFKSPPSIYRITPDRQEASPIISSILDDEIKEAFGETIFLKYKSFDELEIPCFIIESKSPKPGPTILYVHGGPWSEVADSWNISIASLVANGFHVVAPNFRGSTGYGEEFRLLDIGDPGGGDLKDIVYARKYAFEEGIADKVAIMGYSYGGFMTFLATVKEPELWSCGVAGAGITDWSEVYELGDAVFKMFVEVLFDGKRELWKDRSAIHYVEKLKSPLCILHPQNDTRTPLRPVLKYVLKLSELGKTFEMHIAPDMGHILTRMDDAMKILYPALIFLLKHMNMNDSD